MIYVMIRTDFIKTSFKVTVLLQCICSVIFSECLIPRIEGGYVTTEPSEVAEPMQTGREMEFGTSIYIWCFDELGAENLGTKQAICSSTSTSFEPNDFRNCTPITTTVTTTVTSTQEVTTTYRKLIKWKFVEVPGVRCTASRRIGGIERNHSKCAQWCSESEQPCAGYNVNLSDDLCVAREYPCFEDPDQYAIFYRKEEDIPSERSISNENKSNDGFCRIPDVENGYVVAEDTGEQLPVSFQLTANTSVIFHCNEPDFIATGVTRLRVCNHKSARLHPPFDQFVCKLRILSRQEFEKSGKVISDAAALGDLNKIKSLLRRFTRAQTQELLSFRLNVSSFQVNLPGLPRTKCWPWRNASVLVRAIACNESRELVGFLVVSGAAVTNDTEMHFGYSALHYAARLGNEAAVELLVDKGADVNERTNSTKDVSTPLVLAVVNAAANLKLVNYLIFKGADLEFYSTDGFTPLMYAASNGNVDMARLLLDRGAQLEARSANPYQWSPLLLAVANGRAEMVKFLMERGANSTLIGKTFSGRDVTAVELAQGLGHWSVVNILAKV